MYPYHEPMIDTAYSSVGYFASDYDYDLLGRPLNYASRFMQDPIAFMSRKIEANKFVMLMAPWLALFLLILFVLGLRLGFKIHFWFMVGYQWSQWKTIELYKRYRRNKQGLPQDYDAAAHVVYKTMTRLYKINGGNQRLDLPNSAIEYESIRFALEAAWPTGLALHALNVAANPDNAELFAEEALEGEAEDNAGLDEVGNENISLETEDSYDEEEVEISEDSSEMDSDDDDDDHDDSSRPRRRKTVMVRKLIPKPKKRIQEPICGGMLDKRTDWDWYGDRVEEIRLGRYYDDEEPSEDVTDPKTIIGSQ